MSGESYNNAYSTALAVKESIEDVTFRLSKNQKLDAKAELRSYVSNLKKINDTLGHTAGDRLLIETADFLRTLSPAATVFIISQRTSSIKAADLIIVL